ncbi:uncharacterized protein LOC144883506 [Branchiostoma floridae x Branchiostoma japonicum]
MPPSSAMSSSAATTPTPSSPAISPSAVSTPSSATSSSTTTTTTSPSSSPAISSSTATTSTASFHVMSSTANSPSPPATSPSTATTSPSSLSPPPAMPSSTATTSTPLPPVTSSSTASTPSSSAPAILPSASTTTTTTSSPAISSSTATAPLTPSPTFSSSKATTPTSSSAISSSTATTSTPSSTAILSSTATTTSTLSLPAFSSSKATTPTPSSAISSSTATTSTPSPHGISSSIATTSTPSFPAISSSIATTLVQILTSTTKTTTTVITTTRSISTPAFHPPGTTSKQTSESTPTKSSPPVGPTFADTCPQGQTIVVELPADADGRAYINKAVTAWDRNGHLLEVRGNPNLPGYITYSTGPQQVVLEATDGWGMSATCSFTIILKDSHPPKLTCPADINSLSETPGDVITWDEPIAEDNSGQTVRLSANHRPGVRFTQYGVYTVTYTAVDTAGNQATCDFTISIESPAASCDERDLPSVRNGQFSGCRTTAGVTTCTLLCEGGFRPTVTSVDCLPNGRWDHSQALSCLSNQLPVQVSTSMSFRFNDAPCRDNDDFADVVRTQLKASFASTGICRVATQNGLSLCEDNSPQAITSSCQSTTSPLKRRDITDWNAPHTIRKSKCKEDPTSCDSKREKYSKRRLKSADNLLITSPQNTLWLYKIPKKTMHASTYGTEEKLMEIEKMTYSSGDVIRDVRRRRDVSGIDVTVEATVSPNRDKGSTQDNLCSLEQRLNAVTQVVKEKVASRSISIAIDGNSYRVDPNSYSSEGVTHLYADGRKSVGQKCVEDSGWRKNVGIIVPCALLVIVLCLVFVCLSRRKNKRQRQQRWAPRFTDLHTRNNPSFNPYEGDPVYEEIPGMMAGTKQSKGDGLRVMLPPLPRKENIYSVDPTEQKQRPYASGGSYAPDNFKYPATHSLKSYSGRHYSPNPTANTLLPQNLAFGNGRRSSLASQASGKYSTRSDVSTVYENMSDFGSTVSKMAPSVGKKDLDNGSRTSYSVNFGNSVRSSRF